MCILRIFEPDQAASVVTILRKGKCDSRRREIRFSNTRNQVIPDTIRRAGLARSVITMC